MSAIRLVKSVPGFVWLTTAVYVLMLLVGSVTYPLFDVPDERFHADMVIAAAEGSGWPRVGERELGSITAAASRLQTPDPVPEGVLGRRPPNVPLVGDNCVRHGSVPECSYRPSFPELQGLYPRGPINRMTQHPPLYYAVVAASAHGAASVLAPAGGIAYDQQIWAYRLISILLLAPLPLLCWAVTCHLSVLKPVQLASVTIPLALPGLIFRNGPMVNNDNLLVLLGAVMLLALARVVSGRVGPATTAIVGVSMGAGLLTKGLALVYPVVIAVGYLLAVISARRDRRRRILAHACIALAIGALIGGWWWVRNIELYGTIQPSGVPGYGVVEFDDGPVSPPPGFQPDPADWSGRFTVSIGRSFVGDILFDDRAGDRSQWSWLPGVLFVVGLMLGLIRRNHWQLRALLATAIVSMLAAVALVSLDTYVTFGEFRGGAGRYLYSFLPAIAALLADGYGRLFGRDARWLPLASATLAMILGVEGLRSVLTLRWGQVGDGLSDRWMAVLAWSPPAPAVTNTLLIAAAVGMMAVIVSSVVEGVRSKPLGVSPPPCGEQIPSSAPARSG